MVEPRHCQLRRLSLRAVSPLDSDWRFDPLSLVAQQCDAGNAEAPCRRGNYIPRLIAFWTWFPWSGLKKRPVVAKVIIAIFGSRIVCISGANL
jgi:hypothetical protein